MGIGRLTCSVIDVNDLAVAEAFWSEVTGLSVIPSAFPGRFSYLGTTDPWRHQVILHLVRTPKGTEPNRGHVDIWVKDVSAAIAQVEAIGGALKRAPSIYPRPGSDMATQGVAPTIDWAVMHDPFGNEFCVIRLLTREQSRAVAALAPAGDEQYRAAACRAYTKEN